MSKKKRIAAHNKRVQKTAAILKGVGAMFCFLFVGNGVFQYLAAGAVPKSALGSVFIGLAIFVFFSLSSKLASGFEQKFRPPKPVVPKEDPAKKGSAGQSTDQHFRAFIETEPEQP